MSPNLSKTQYLLPLTESISQIRHTTCISFGGSNLGNRSKQVRGFNMYFSPAMECKELKFLHKKVNATICGTYLF